MLVELWDSSAPTFAEILGSFSAGACSVQFAKEFRGAAVSRWKSWRQALSGSGAEDCSKASAQ